LRRSSREAIEVEEFLVELNRLGNLVAHGASQLLREDGDGWGFRGQPEEQQDPYGLLRGLGAHGSGGSDTREECDAENDADAQSRM
jgi:hypothetical protein